MFGDRFLRSYQPLSKVNYLFLVLRFPWLLLLKSGWESLVDSSINKKRHPYQQWKILWLLLEDQPRRLSYRFLQRIAGLKPRNMLPCFFNTILLLNSINTYLSKPLNMQLMPSRCTHPLPEKAGWVPSTTWKLLVWSSFGLRPVLIIIVNMKSHCL